MTPTTNIWAWQLLQLQPGASETQIRQAYRRLCREHHPDLGGNAEDFINITRAQELLLQSLLTPAAAVQLDLSITVAESIAGTERWIQLPHMQHHSIHICIPAGRQPGDVVKYARALPADQDLLVRLQVQIPAGFHLRHCAACCTVPVNFWLALLGGTISVQNLLGNSLEIAVPAGSTNQTLISVPGEGVWCHQLKARGDMLVQLRPLTPELSAQQQQLLRSWIS